MRQLERERPGQCVDKAVALDRALCHMESMLHVTGRSLQNFKLPMPQDLRLSLDDSMPGAQELCQTELDRRYDQLTVEQRSVVDRILDASTGLFFIDAPGGHGSVIYIILS